VLRNFVGTITALPPEQVVAIAEGFVKFAAAIVALNAALKGFAAVRAAYVALTSPLGALAAVFGGGAAATVYTAQNLPPGFIGGGAAVPALPGLEQDRLARAAAAAPVGQRRPGNVVGRGGGSSTVVVNGIVGSPYQVFRELERAQAAGTRSGIGSAR